MPLPEHPHFTMRVEYIDWCIKEYRRTSPDVQDRVIVDKAAEKVAKEYFRLYEKVLNPVMDRNSERIDRHKIISATQCAIMVIMPIRETKEQCKSLFEKLSRPLWTPALRKLNANFGVHVSVAMLQHWMDYDGLPQDAIDVIMKRAGWHFFETHETWLANSLRDARNLSNTPDVNIQEIRYLFPFFLNAQLWYALEMLHPAAISSNAVDPNQMPPSNAAV